MDKLRKTTEKLLSLFLAAAMCVSLMPSGVTAFAAGPTADGENAVEAEGHTVELGDCENGVLTLVNENGEPTDTSEYGAGDTVLVNVKPEEGYDFTGITLNIDAATIITDEHVDELTVAFEMPENDIVVDAEAEAEPESPISTLADHSYSAGGYSVLVYLADQWEDITFSVFYSAINDYYGTMTVRASGAVDSVTFTYTATQTYYGDTETLGSGTAYENEFFSFDTLPHSDSAGSGSDTINIYVSATWPGEVKNSPNPTISNTESGTAHLTRGSSKSYGSWGTGYYSVNFSEGNKDWRPDGYSGNAFCIEPSYRRVSDGYYSYAKLTELSGLSSGKAETMRKVLWVSYNAPGYQSSYWPSLGSISDKYVLTLTTDENGAVAFEGMYLVTE